MTSISSLVYSAYSAASTRSLDQSTTDAEATASTTDSDTTEDTEASNPVSEALANAEDVGDELASSWAQATAKAEMVYLLITGDDMSGDDSQDLITNMLLTAYDELYSTSDEGVSLEDMPSYASALSAWAELNGVTSTISLTA